MATSEAQRRAQKNYRKKVKQVVVGFAPQEADLYEWLCEQPAKATYIKGLIREDMERGRREV